MPQVPRDNKLIIVPGLAYLALIFTLGVVLGANDFCRNPPEIGGSDAHSKPCSPCLFDLLVRHVVQEEGEFCASVSHSVSDSFPLGELVTSGIFGRMAVDFDGFDGPATPFIALVQLSPDVGVAFEGRGGGSSTSFHAVDHPLAVGVENHTRSIDGIAEVEESGGQFR